MAVSLPTPTGCAELEIRTVGVVGAGVMGIGVAQCLAQSEYVALLVDLNDEILERARRQIKENLRLQALFEKGMAPNSKAVLGRITFSSDCRILEKADFLIENVTDK